MLWGGEWGGGGGSSHPVPSLPLRRQILAHGGSLLVSVYLVLVVLATCFCWPTYRSLCPGRSFMMFAGLLALAWCGGGRPCA